MCFLSHHFKFHGRKMVFSQELSEQNALRSISRNQKEGDNRTKLQWIHNQYLQNEAISCFHVIQIHFFPLAYKVSSEFTCELVILNLLAKLSLWNDWYWLMFSWEFYPFKVWKISECKVKFVVENLLLIIQYCGNGIWYPSRDSN